MGIKSKIEWTEHTLNFWWGCQKVSPACDNCYAEKLDNRWQGGHWGAKGPRKEVKSWRKSLKKMQRQAQKDGKNHRVFVMSMGDIFEKSTPLEGGGATSEIRQEFFGMIPDYPELTFLLLTKRPGLIGYSIPDHWISRPRDFPQNVWFGCSVENQEVANREIPKLLAAPGTGNKFLSMEPLLGPVDIRNAGISNGYSVPTSTTAGGTPCEFTDPGDGYIGVDWIIVGGESGPGARPMHPDWVRSIRDQCEEAGVPFFFKQWGAWLPQCHKPHQPNAYKFIEPEYGECFDHPEHAPPSAILKGVGRVGKKASGRFLDNRTHDDYPERMTAKP